MLIKCGNSSKHNMKQEFTERQLDRIIEMAWEDRTPFELWRQSKTLKKT